MMNSLASTTAWGYSLNSHENSSSVEASVDGSASASILGSQSPIECSKLQIIAIICSVLFVASLASNSLLLHMLITCKHLKQPVNTFLIALTICNIVGTLFELPFTIASNLMCR